MDKVDENVQLQQTESSMKVVKPRGAFLNYYINECKGDGEDKGKMSLKVRKLAAKWKVLPIQEKLPFIEQTVAQQEQYKNEVQQLKRQKLDDEKKKGLVATRCSPFNLCKLFKQLKEKHIEGAVESIGFGLLLLLKDGKLPRELCENLVQNFNVATSSMEVDGENIPFTVEDVEGILGLANEGVEVSTVMEREDAEVLCNKFNIPTHRKMSFVRLEQEILEFEADCEELKARLLLYIVGRFLCPTTEGGPSKEYYYCLTEDGLNGKLNWAKHVHEKLLLGIRSFHARKMKSSKVYLTGCLLLLVIRFYDHISGVRSMKEATSTFVPRISAWGTDEVVSSISHSRDFRVGLKSKGIHITEEHHTERPIQEEQKLYHTDLQALRESMKSLEASVTEQLNRMSEDMKSMQEKINALLSRSVEVKTGGETSLQKKDEEGGIIEVGGQSTELKTPGGELESSIEIIERKAEEGDGDLTTPVRTDINNPSSSCPAPRKKKGQSGKKNQIVRSRSTFASGVSGIVTRARSTFL